MLRVGRFGLQHKCVPEFRSGLVQFALVERDVAFRNVQVRVLLPVVGSGQVAALLQFRRGLVALSCTRQSQPELIVSRGILRIHSHRFLKLRDGLLESPFPEKFLAQRQARSREARLGYKYFAQLIDFFCWSVVRVCTVSHG